MDRLNRSERSSLPPPTRGGLPIVALAEIPLGVLAGLALGAFAGPVGLVVGAIGGGLAGGALSIALHRQGHRNSELTDRYDEEVGITQGDMGVWHLEHPPPSLGLYSSTSAGMRGDYGGNLAAGPFQEID